nr:cobalamin biosynthesis protein [Nocardia sp. BMG51109]
MATAELAVGVGCRPGTPAEEIVAAIREVVHPSMIRCIATVGRRAGEAGMVGAAADLGVLLVSFTAAELAQVDVPNPATRAEAAIGTPSVAEAAALKAAGGDRLAVTKRVVGRVAIAVARFDG